MPHPAQRYPDWTKHGLDLEPSGQVRLAIVDLQEGVWRVPSQGHESDSSQMKHPPQTSPGYIVWF